MEGIDVTFMGVHLTVVYRIEQPDEAVGISGGITMEAVKAGGEDISVLIDQYWDAIEELAWNALED
jgi:hypothetical protein